jgi:hypothetical protein
MSLKIGQLNIYDLRSNGGDGDGGVPKAFKDAINLLASPPVSVSQKGNPSSSNGNPSSFHRFSALANSIYYPSSAGADDVTNFEDTKNPSFQIGVVVPGESSPDRSGSAADGAGPAAPDQPSRSPTDYLTVLQNGTATGDPPDDLTLPPGTTAADVANMNGGLLNNLNQGHSSGSTGAGDAAAQKYGYKDMNALLADKSPEAAAVAGKILWAARACNNLTEADGAERPANEQSANTLAGVHVRWWPDPRRARLVAGSTQTPRSKANTFTPANLPMPMARP